jgi:hypothetical protein
LKKSGQEVVVFRAMIIGAVVAIIGSFLLAGACGFLFGEPWGEGATGWRGMHSGVVSLIFVGTMLPFFPNVALAGAALGLMLWTVGRLWAIPLTDQRLPRI